MRVSFTVLVACLVSSTAFAGPPPAPGSSPRQPAPGPNLPAAPSFDCSVTPEAPPTGDNFQTTDVTVTKVSGTLATNKKIEVRLGVSANGPVLTTICTSSFGRSTVARANNTIVAPPIMDSDYIWVCNARATNQTCDAAPGIPR